jgi:hypothetical protein
MPVSMSLKDGSAWVRGLANNLPTAAKRGLYSAGLRIMADLQNDNSLPRDRGTYRAGWRCDPTDQGAEVHNVAMHGLFIEESVRSENVKIGRRMIDALAEWAKRKGLGVTYKAIAPGKKGGAWVSGKGYVKAIKATKDELRAIAWAIAISIKRRGLFNAPIGLKPLANAFKLNGRRYAEEEVKREVMKAAFGK